MCFSGVFISDSQRHAKKPSATFFCFAVCLYLQGAERLIKPLNVPYGERYCTPCKKARRKAFYLAFWLVLRCAPDRLPLARLGGRGGLLLRSVLPWPLCCVVFLMCPGSHGSEAVQLAPLARSQGLHVLQLSGVRHVLRIIRDRGGYICASVMQFESAHTTPKTNKKGWHTASPGQ